MKFFLLLLGLAFQVSGFGLYGGYERMFFYYAYLLDKDLNNGVAKKIAVACSDCHTFDKFIAWVNEDKGVPTKITDSRFPDIDTTAQLLEDKRKAGTYALYRVLEGCDGEPNVAIPKAFQAISMWVSGNLEKGKVPQSSMEIVQAIQNSMERISFFRTHARSEVMRKMFEERGYKVITEAKQIQLGSRTATRDFVSGSLTAAANPAHKSDISRECLRTDDAHVTNIMAAKAAFEMLCIHGPVSSAAAQHTLAQLRLIGMADNSSAYAQDSSLRFPNTTFQATADITTTQASLSSGECKPLRVSYRDSCHALAVGCGLSDAEFLGYNTAPNLCSRLQAGQYVCCSAGTLPDMKPKTGLDGSCATYRTVESDSCNMIAHRNNLEVKDIEKYNQHTWQWTGCKELRPSMAMCLSSGSAPLPPPLAGAICGPQVPGTSVVPNGTAVADLNPCPLNTCCNARGQCGTTKELCTPVQSHHDAGYADRCISNCGTEIVDNAVKPSTFLKMAYFDAEKYQEGCLDLQVSGINTVDYTHIVLASAKPTRKFQIDISTIAQPFDQLKLVQGSKKVLSIGGWSFSSHPDTFSIFREGVQPHNRERFARNVARFVVEHRLDGVEFDWNFPGANDIPGIPAGKADEGRNYVGFLQMVRYHLPVQISVSVTAPASINHLQGFPILDLARTVDYIVYKTYDLHGQWDYGRPLAMDGCPTGNCLRSHVNLTETLQALSVITKAGAPARQVVVGVASFGRSFRMSEKNCVFPWCTFTGPQSGTLPGVCTQDAGFLSNVEINDIGGGEGQIWFDYYDTVSDSNVLVYDDRTHWVAYMNSTVKKGRVALYEKLNFLGAADWALNLQEIANPLPEFKLELCRAAYETLEDIERDRPIMPDSCVNQYLIQFLSTNLTRSLEKYNRILQHDYDRLYAVYSDYYKEQQPKLMHDWVFEHSKEFFTCLENDGHSSKAFEVPCPDNMKSITGGTVQWILKNEDGFFEGLWKDLHIERERVTFTRIVHDGALPCAMPPSCSVGWEVTYEGWPFVAEYPSMENPKILIEHALQNLTALDKVLKQTVTDIQGFLYPSSTADVIGASSLLVLSVHGAVTSMNNAVILAEEVEELHRKEQEMMIVSCVTALLFLIPMAGEVAIAASVAVTASRIAVALGEVALTATDIYEIIQDPSPANIVLGIFGAVLSGATISREAGHEVMFKQGADLWKKLPDADLVKLGPMVHDTVKKVDGMKRICA